MNKTKTINLFNSKEDGLNTNICFIINSDGSIKNRNIIKQENKEKRAAYNKQYRKENRKILLKYHKWYNHNNRDKINKLNRQWHNDNREYHNEKCKQWKKDNPEKIKEWLINNPDYTKKWRINNPEKYIKIWMQMNSRRKGWGYEPINNYTKEYHFHHMHIEDDHSIGIFIPPELHRSIFHAYNDPESMDKINEAALEWLRNQ
ncbi:MAG: hypothetical protein KKB59_19070 [Spirochaetes bacterium]|nr:hypothetical protein [Spirochaetota bacterium]